MKQDVNLDFGTAIAYLVPGVVAVRGVSLIYPELAKLFAFGNRDSSDLAIFVLLALVGLAAGLIVSAFRAAVIDPTFAIDLSFARKLAVYLFARNQKLSSAIDYALKYLDPSTGADPIFTNLANDARLAAYNEAKAADKRPYQFYGNILVAMLTYLGCAYFRSDVLVTEHYVLLRFGYAATLLILYASARRSHFRYMESVVKFNSLPAPP